MTSDPRATEIATLLGRLAELMTDSRPAEPLPAQPRPERVLLTAEEAAEQLGIGRTLMYRLIRSGEVESIRVGRLRRIPTDAVRAYAVRLVGNPARIGNQA